MSISITELRKIVGKTQTREEAEEGILLDTDYVTVPYAEYRQLVACETMLDMILLTKSESGYYQDSVIKAAHSIRDKQVEQNSRCLFIHPPLPSDETAEGGAEDE